MKVSGIRKRNLFDPASGKPFRLSRSKLDLFLECPRCFYIDRRLGVGRPAGFPFNLNSAVDHLLKVEFDSYRKKGQPHPLMVENGIDAIPFRHPKLNDWRFNFKGVSYLHTPTNFEVFGAVDDLWIDKVDQVIVVDYKATSKNGEVSLNADWQIAYKRQMEIYQWLVRRNGLEVSNTGYFVYCNGRRDLDAFDARLEFVIKVLPYVGDDGWVEDCIKQAHQCLSAPDVPEAEANCEYCAYRQAADYVVDKGAANDPQSKLL